jgi:uncharacterized phage protein (TIGR01671 family)
MKNRERKHRVWTGHKMEYDVLVGVLGAFYVPGLDENDSACISPFNTKFPPESPVMDHFGYPDKNGKDIYQGDIIELTNDRNEKIRVVCEYGTVQRRIVGGTVNLCDITGFYFRNQHGQATFPIFENYQGKNDVELFEVIGNIYENPELFTHGK